MPSSRRSAWCPLTFCSPYRRECSPTPGFGHTNNPKRRLSITAQPSGQQGADFIYNTNGAVVITGSTPNCINADSRLRQRAWPVADLSLLKMRFARIFQ